MINKLVRCLLAEIEHAEAPSAIPSARPLLPAESRDQYR